MITRILLFKLLIFICMRVLGNCEFQVFEEKAYLVGVERKGDTEGFFGIEESLKELAQLADTAGLRVVGSTYQK